MAKCVYVKPDGERCQANAIKTGRFCFSHDPDYKEEKTLVTRRGGLNRKLCEEYGEPIRLKGPKDIKELLGKVINGVWTGQIPAGQPANTLGFLCRCWLDAHEKLDIEKRVKRLEVEFKRNGR